MKKLLMELLCLSAAWVVCGSNAEATQYVMRDLGTCGRAYDINKYNQVVGEAYIGGSTLAFKWDPAIGLAYYSNMTTARAINDSGTIAGNSCGSACYLQNNNLVILSTGTPSTGYAYAWDINESNQIVGDIANRAWIWDSVHGKQVMKSLGVNENEAVCINDSGQAAGSSRGNGGNLQACIWDASGNITNLGAILGQVSEAWGINDLGQVTGEYNNRNSGFVWDPINGVIEQGLNNCIPDDINNRAEVVGRYYTAGSYHAFYWKDGQMMDLNDLNPGNFSWATSINDNGWIAGMAWDSQSNLHAVVWQPVPEPSSILALLSGVAGLGGLALRKRN